MNTPDLIQGESDAKLTGTFEEPKLVLQEISCSWVVLCHSMISLRKKMDKVIIQVFGSIVADQTLHRIGKINSNAAESNTVHTIGSFDHALLVGSRAACP